MVFWFDGRNVNLATPEGSAKVRFVRYNPNVCFEVDNRKLTLEAQGLLIHGFAEVLDQNLASFFRTLPIRVGFFKKYSHLSDFYATGQELPEDKKIQRYRIINDSTEGNSVLDRV